jgi:hypothetical protein
VDQCAGLADNYRRDVKVVAFPRFGVVVRDLLHPRLQFGFAT